MPIRIDLTEEGQWEVLHVGHGFSYYKTKTAALKRIVKAMEEDRDLWERCRRENAMLEGKTVKGLVGL